MNWFTTSNISTAFCRFYTVKEICEAKELLFGYVINSGLPSASSQVTRKGNGKRRADTADIMAALEFADRASRDLPTFYATLSSRVPTVSPSEVDAVALVINLEALRGLAENITAALNAMSEAQKNSVEMANSVLLNQ